MRQPGDEELLKLCKGNTICDANRGTMRCLVCGDEVPMPLGVIDWVVDVVKTFGRCHKGDDHPPGRTCLHDKGIALVRIGDLAKGVSNG